MFFTDRGVSGPVILTLSGHCVDSLIVKKKVMLCIDLKPALDHHKIDQRILRDIKDSPNKAVKNLLKGLLPAKLIDVWKIRDCSADKADLIGH